MRELTLSFFRLYISFFSGLPRFCWERILIILLCDIASGICLFLSIYFVKDLGLSITTVGMLISSFGIGKIFGGITSGRLVDSFSANIISITSLLSMSVSLSLFVFLKTPVSLAMNSFVCGFSFYGLITSNSVYLLEKLQYSKTLKLKTLNILYTTSNLGIGFSALILGILSESNFNYMFIFSSFILLLCVAMTLKNEKRDKSHHLLSEKAEEAGSTKKGASTNTKAIFVVLVSLFLIGLIIVQRQVTYSVYIHQQLPNIGLYGIGFLFSLNPFLIIVLQTPLVEWLSRFNKMLVLGFGGFLMGLGSVLLSLPLSLTLAVLSCVVYTLGEMIFMPISQFINYEKSDNKTKGTSFGIYKTVFASSMVVGPLWGSMMFQFVSAQHLWLFCGFLGLFVLVICVQARQWIS